MTTATLRVTIAGAISALDTSGLLTTTGPLHAPGRLAVLERDARFEVRYVVVAADTDGRERVLLVVPCWLPRLPAWPDPVYAQLVSGLCGAPVAMNRCLLVGGYGDVPAGVLRAAELMEEWPAAVAALGAAAAAADELARAHRRVRVAPLVTERERPWVEPLLGADPRVGSSLQEAWLPVPGAGPDDFVAALSRNARKKVRRELDHRADSTITVRRRDWEQVLDRAPALICDVAHRHGVPEHPELVRHRLEQWGEAEGVRRVAFEARRGEQLLAICLVLRAGGVVLSYAVGTCEPATAGHLEAYVETTIYGPLAWAYESGCREVALGFGTATPKRQRGATVTDAVALLSTSDPGGLP